MCSKEPRHLPQPGELPLRDMVIPSILRQIVGNYMMPEARLPVMNCHGCLYRQEEWRDGGHCYMFREKPEGNRCGQFKDNREPPACSSEDEG